jgi:hypothetical protein
MFQFSVKELREILKRWDDPCTGCVASNNHLLPAGAAGAACADAGAGAAFHFQMAAIEFFFVHLLQNFLSL